MTTALVALTCGHNAYAQISDDININQDTVITAENQQNYRTTGNIFISGGNVSASNTEGMSQLHDGSGQKEISITGGSIALSNGAGIYADGKDGQYNTTAATMNITGGDITVKDGGDITVKDGGEITLTGNADMNIGGNAKITMDYIPSCRQSRCTASFSFIIAFASDPLFKNIRNFVQAPDKRVINLRGKNTAKIPDTG